MPKKSAGILLYRRTTDEPEVLLVHPGGPFWKNKDAGAWSIPKGEFDDSEEAETAARREFAEELGISVPEVTLVPLDVIRYTSGKYIHCWAGEADLDVRGITSNTFEIEWPPRSGREQTFPEVDRADWFAFETALEKIHKGQRALLEQLKSSLEPRP